MGQDHKMQKLIWYIDTHTIAPKNYKFTWKLSSQIPFWLHLVQFIIGLASLVSFGKTFAILDYTFDVKQSVRPHI